LAFMLADHGYDVWLPNFRGNTYSQKSTDKNFFQKATWHFMADYDLPNTIDYVLEKRGMEKLHLVGHSQGSIVSFAMLAQNISTSKVDLFFAMAPILQLDEGVHGAMGLLFKYGSSLPHAIAASSLTRWMYGTSVMDTRALPTGKLSAIICSIPILNLMCGSLYDMLYNRKFTPLSANDHMNASRLSLLNSQFPGGTTLMNLATLSDNYQRDVWVKTDYRKFKQLGISNLKEYGQEEPPTVDFRNVKVDLVMFRTNNDVFISTEQQLVMLNKVKGNIIENGDYLIDQSWLSHHDQVVAIDASTYIYYPILEHLRQRESKKGIDFERYRSRALAYGFGPIPRSLKKSFA